MKLLKVMFFLGVLSMIAITSMAAENSVTAKVIEITGTVEVMTQATPWQPATVGMILNQGDVIRTRAKSWAILELNGTVEVKENSQLKLAELIENKETGTKKTLLDLALGQVLIKAQKLQTDDSKFEVKTPTSIVGVRGTEFSVAVESFE